MSDSTPPRRGLYFEEFAEGESYTTVGRTIGEADVTQFAGLSGDFNSLHTDAVYAAAGDFGQRVAHGLLVLSIASGLAVRTGIMEGTVMAFREINDWKFTRPVYFGDTIHVRLTTESLKAFPRLGGGAIVLGVDVINQDDQSVMRGRWTMLVRSRPEGG